MMAENNECSAQYMRRKQIREPPTVPFLWEKKPGVPIKNWKPEKRVQNHPVSAPQPQHLVASVPFIWEEKPGKPMPFLLMDHDEYSESESNWDCDSMSGYMTRTTTDSDSYCSSIVVAKNKAQPTLGELIMMSRRLSIRRRREQMRNLSMDMLKRGNKSCFNITKKVSLVDWKMKMQPLLNFKQKTDQCSLLFSV